MRQCRYLTTPCWRPHAGATLTVALTVKRRMDPEELSSVSVFDESMSRGIARTTTDNWDTETETSNSWTEFSFSH